MNEYIVVHPGGVHLDEILAVGLICDRHGLLSVYRREPSKQELDDERVWVVDVGMEHIPEKRNFDHHQFAADAAPDCALSLVAKHLDLHGLLMNRPWYEAQVKIDSKGFPKTASELGLTQPIPPGLLSPLDMGLKTLWVENGQGAVNEAVVTIATQLAGALVKEAQQFVDELKTAREKTEFVSVCDVPIMVHHFVAGNDVSNHLKAEWEADSSKVVAASLSHDSREPFGWALYRFNDDERIDFSKIADEQVVSFAHPAGFIAKTNERIEMNAAKALIEKAVC